MKDNIKGARRAWLAARQIKRKRGKYYQRWLKGMVAFANTIK